MRPRSVMVCAIACDEEPFVDGFVECALALGGPVLVGDTGSTDDTVGRLRHGGAQVIEVPRRVLLRGGFAAARNYVLDRVPREIAFVHWVDLDERVTVEGKCLPSHQPYGEITTRTYAFDATAELSDWRSILTRPFSDAVHTRVHRNDPRVRWAGLVHEELWGSWHRFEKLEVTHHHLMHYRDADRRARKHRLYAFLLWRGLTVRALRHGTNPWWFTTRVRALEPNALAAERDEARRCYEENRAFIDFEVDWRLPRLPWWRRLLSAAR